MFTGALRKKERELSLFRACAFCDSVSFVSLIFCEPVRFVIQWVFCLFDPVSFLILCLFWACIFCDPVFFYCDSVTFEIMCLLWFCIFVGHVSFVIQCLLLRSCIFCVPVPFVILYLCWSCAFCVTVPFAILAFCDTVPFVILAFCDTMPFVTLYLLLYCACDPVSLKIQWFLWSCNFVDLMPFSILFFV